MIQSPAILLTTAEMAASDRAAIEAGTPETELIEAAGWQVARLVRQHYKPRKTLVLCGPGNNGGDGLVAARLLSRWGWPVTIASHTDLSLDLLRGDPLIVDALFGAGLKRPLEGAVRSLIEEISARGLPVVAVDLPSGVHGDSGEIMGTAFQAEMTVTFVAAKPGH